MPEAKTQENKRKKEVKEKKKTKKLKCRIRDEGNQKEKNI